MNWKIVVGFIIVLSSSWRVCGMLYTRCNSSNSVAYKQEPLYTCTCKSLAEAVTQCLKYSLCDLISKTGTRCSFHTAVDRNVTCDTVGMYSGTVTKVRFRSCNCTLIQDFWVDAGPFYLYVTPNSYECTEGQAVCMSLGGFMAEFYSTDELNFALAYITESVYVGGHLQGGKYVCFTTRQDIMASLWVPGEPNGEVTCVQIWHAAKGLDDFWTGVPLPILCQKRLQ